MTRETLPITWSPSNIPGEATADLGDVELLINPHLDGSKSPPKSWAVSVRTKAARHGSVLARASLSCTTEAACLAAAQTLVDVVRSAVQP